MDARLSTITQLSVNIQDVYACLGYNRNEVPEDINFLIKEVLNDLAGVCQARYLYTLLPGQKQSERSINISGIEFKTGKMITSYLDGVEKFCVFVATAGEEYVEYKSRLRNNGDFIREFIVDAIGSVIAESCVSMISAELTEKGLKHTYPYSPGYCGWKLTEQTNLFSLLPESPCGIELTDSCLMIPVKSISGVIATGDNVQKRDYGCAICENINCYKRKIL